MTSVVDRLELSGVISPIVRSYLREIRYGISRPVWWTRFENERRFFRQFVPHGGLVFDVGANTGDMTYVFRLLGARVIAFEPQGEIYQQLEMRYSEDDRVVPINVALGRESGRARLILGSDHSTTSLSEEYIAKVVERGALGDATWTPGSDVPIRTMDEMIVELGRPDFVKIDVEGFEAEVLAGLGTAVPALSFEITSEHIAPAVECVDHLSTLGEYEYNWSGLWSNVLQCDSWLSSREARDLVSTWPLRQAHYPRKADVYARAVRSR